MADPTKVPGNTDPNYVAGRNPNDPKRDPVIRNRRNYPWAWIVAIIVLLLIIWAFFGMNNRSRVVNPATGPAPTASTTR